MEIPDRIISLAELRRNNGDPGRRKYVAYRGIVYDVTDCPRWRLDLHERQHFSGLDLSSEMKDAPHQAEVFTRPCVHAVGKYIEPD
jgi:predicted heme/steroid binding protein